MGYRITGMGDGAVEAHKPTLTQAARTASKMIDQGVLDVRLFDADGIEVPAEEWNAAWWRWAEG